MNHTTNNHRYQLWESGRCIAEAIVHDYVFNRIHKEDAEQEVMLALWEATQTWQEGIHSNFEQYAFYVMRGKLFYYLTQKAEDKPILSKKERDILKGIRKSIEKGQMISSSLMAQISIETGIKTFRLQQIINYWYASHVAISASVLNHFEEPSSGLNDYLLDSDQDHCLESAVETLSERERIIIISRFLEDPRQTLSALSKKFGVSIERIRVIEGKSLKKLRAILEKNLAQ